MKCATLSQKHIFQGRSWGRESECVVCISQFAPKSEECIALLDISPLPLFNTPERFLAAQCAFKYSKTQSPAFSL